jgi:hypothetical protein
MISLFTKCLPLMALLFSVGPQAKAATITSTLSLGPGTSLSGQQSISFLVTNPVSASFDASFSEASSLPSNCHPVNASLPFSCAGSVSPEVTISTSGGGIQDLLAMNYGFALGCSGGPSTCTESDDFVGFDVICNNSEMMLGSAVCSITTLPIGSYVLTIFQNENLDAGINSTITPFTDSVTATLIGNVVPTPEPSAGVLAVLLLAALLRFIPADSDKE